MFSKSVINLKNFCDQRNFSIIFFLATVIFIEIYFINNVTQILDIQHDDSQFLKILLHLQLLYNIGYILLQDTVELHIY